MGRPRKPTHMKILHGDRKDRINRAEPVPSAVDVTPPAWLRPEALQVWRRLAPDLERKGVLTAWDVDKFAILCDAVVQYQAASKLVETAGVLIEGRRDGVVKNPAMQVVRDLAQTIRAYAADFGLSPVDRSRLTLRADEPSPYDDLLTGGA